MEYKVGDVFQENNSDCPALAVFKIVGVDDSGYTLEYDSSIENANDDLLNKCVSSTWINMHFTKFNGSEGFLSKTDDDEVRFAMKYKDDDTFKDIVSGEEIYIADCDEFDISCYHTSKGDWLTEEEMDERYFKCETIVKGDFSGILSSINDMLNEKDKRYGNSALKPLKIFSKHLEYGSRIDEKLARVKNSDELRKNDIADIIGGLVLICRDKGWEDFSDQID